MKKIVLSLAGVLAATAFAPEAAAVPSFARQTGMACNSCHFQSYPALTSFGRAFKSGGYTMIGAQAKVEGEHGLSIPAVLNASLYTQLRYIKTGGTNAPGAVNTNTGRFDVPDEMALFFGGRGSENIGFLLEVPLVATNFAGANGATFANLKMPFVFDAGSAKISLIPFTSSGVGVTAGFDLFGTGSNGAGRVVENGMGYSAAMYMGATNNAGSPSSDATGVALVVSNETFHVNLTPYAGTFAGNTTTTKLGATYLRAGWTPSFNNWDLGIGLQNFSGKPSKGTGLVATEANEARLTIIDAQAQGEVAGMPLGIYGSYGSANASSAAPGVGGSGVNIYNSSTTNRKTSFGVLADLWVMPGTLGIQAGFMRAKTGQVNANTGGQENDNSYTIGARYKIRQNVKAGFAYTKFTGSANDIGGSGGANTANYSNAMAPGVLGAAPGRGTSRYTFILSSGF